MTVQSTGAPVHNSLRACGVLDDQSPEWIVMRVPGTDYRLRLSVYKPVESPIGKRLVGTIRAAARRIDLVGSGGEFVEPVYGEPRRIQGSVLASDATDQTITIKTCVPITVKVGPGQRSEQFPIGAMVSFDALSGTSFVPA